MSIIAGIPGSMKNVTPLVERLRALEAFEDASLKPADHASEIERLRATLPAPVLDHHDQRRRRGQRSLAVVVNGACSHCQSIVPKALLIQMQREGSLGMCPECNGYLYVEERAGRESGMMSLPPKSSRL